MATFDFHRLGVGVVSSDIISQVLSYGPLKSLKVATSSDTEFTLKPNSYSTWRYTGEDFDYSSKSDPIKGTIQSMVVLAPGQPQATFSITGLDIDIAEMKTAFKSPSPLDDLAFLNAIFKGNDTFLGTRSADQLFGLGGKDTMEGSDGADSLDGGASKDTIHGDKGNDVLTGGAAADKFVFDTKFKIASGNIDTITDFDGTAGDKIVLDNAFYKGLATGALADAAFVATDDHTGLTAVAEARVVYNTTTGDLYFDFAGDAGMRQFAHLDGTPTLTADYFNII